VLRKIRDQRRTASPYLGYGYPTILMEPMFRSLGWDPPRIMTERLPVLATPSPSGWPRSRAGTGVDQMCEDNPRLRPMLDRFAAHLGIGATTR